MTTNKLSETVLTSNLCIGCGVCAYLSPGTVSVRLDHLGFLRPSVPKVRTAKDDFDGLSPFCPMSGEGPDEDSLAESCFSQNLHYHPRIGRYLGCYAARVNDPAVYLKSSSGGIGRWLLGALMDQGVIDAAAIVMPHRSKDPGELLFRYGIATTPAQVLQSATSAYYPVEMSEILKYIRNTPGRYAITALPCFSKALRTLCAHDSVMRERIVVILGTICGHLKGTFYAELLGWQLGVPPDDLSGIDFRVKIPGCRANEKGVAAYSRSDPAKQHGPVKVQELYGTNYGAGFFKYEACDYCDDVVAETADVSIGDAWLPQYLDRGTSLVIVRQKWIHDLLELARDANQLTLEPLSADTAASSQDAGLRHRRDGLAYRLHLADKDGRWRPRKRVAPDATHLTARERSIHRYRIQIAALSTKAFCDVRRAGTVKDFQSRMAPLISKYKAHYGSFLGRGIKRLAAMVGIRF